ncbi:MAG TPA: hypothetical protein VMF08_20270 [Candidatus Sulfotelmatobacter sp.]|nr:hypothetical protein [Candidatus Sulfotelmatobacter sp.]
MRIKKALTIDHVAAAVCEDVRRHFGNTLPPEWKDIVCAAVYPGLAAAPHLRGSAGLDNFLNCWERDPDLMLEILTFARLCCAKYMPHKCDTQAALVKAVLLTYQNAVKQNGGYRMLTPNEVREYSKACGRGKRPRLKFVPVRDLTDGEIAQWINSGYRTKVTEASVKEARQALSSTPRKGKK